MSEADPDVIQTFNSLTQTTLDSAEGYDKAADLARNPRFQTLFRERAQKRRQLADELKAKVGGLGGEPWETGSIGGLTHRAFLELRDRIGRQSDKPIIEEVERGETLIRDRFAEAARDSALPGDAREVLKQALSAIQAEHDEIGAIRREFDHEAPPKPAPPAHDDAVEPVPPADVQPPQT